MKDFQAVIDFLTADSEVPERGEREERDGETCYQTKIIQNKKHQ